MISDDQKAFYMHVASFIEKIILLTLTATLGCIAYLFNYWWIIKSMNTDHVVYTLLGALIILVSATIAETSWLLLIYDKIKIGSKK